jgi:hypothetical protein
MMKTYQKQILGIEDWQPEPIESLVSSVPVQEGEKPENIIGNVMSFSLAPEYSKEQLREMNRRTMRFSRNQRFSMRLRLEARPY